MAKVTVRHNRLSRYSSIGMIVLGLIAFFFYGFPGLVIIAIGVVMYWFYRRQSGATPSRSNNRVKDNS